MSALAASAPPPRSGRVGRPAAGDRRGRWRRRTSSLIVLLPLAAVVVESSVDGWAGFWDAITTPQAVAALKLHASSPRRSSSRSTP